MKNARKPRSKDGKGTNPFLPRERFSLGAFRGVLWSLFVFRFVGGGIAALTAIFVFQIYDRVLASHSLPTLAALALIFAVFYTSHGVLSAIGGRLATRASGVLLDQYEPIFMRLSARLREAGTSKIEAQGPLNDFLDIAAFLPSRALAALFDLAWVPILLLVLLAISPFMALFAGVLCLLQLAASLFLLAPVAKVAERSGRELWRLSLQRDYAAAAPASRIADRVAEAKIEDRRANRAGREQSGDSRSANFAFREIAQSGMLVVGAWLVLSDAMSIGSMMASGMLMMRVFIPVQVFGRDFPEIRRMRAAYRRLQQVDLSAERSPPEPKTATDRSENQGRALTVSRLSLTASKAEGPFGAAQFVLEPGQCLMIAGRSGGGKTVFLKRLAGLIPSRPGAIQLGDAFLSQIDADQRARLVGYLPQDHVFLPGTIREAIEKFDATANRAETRDRAVAAAKQVGAHDAIMALPDGYATRLPPEGNPLPHSLLRLIAFARAIVDSPAILLLDDPFSGHSQAVIRHLGERIAEWRARGTIILLAQADLTHSEIADLAMIVEGGKMLAFGEISEVMARPAGPRLLREGNRTRRGGASP